MAGLSCITTDTTAASLEEILIRKGVITREELEEIKAEEAAETAEKDRQMEAEVERKVEARVTEKLESESPVKASYTKKGFRLETRDGNWATNLQWRAQMRYSYPFGSAPRTLSQFRAADVRSNFDTRRLRMKIGGHGYRPWIKYYFEVDLQPQRDVDDSSAAASSRVIDWRLTLDKYQWAALRVGQWKINYNRERVDSSGKQQFVERSIVNREFTIDRQIGALIMGRLFPGTFADFRYYAGVFNGEGRGVRNASDDMMYMGRFQWNFLGRDLKWTQSDLKYHEDPAGTLAFAAASTIGPCTRFSSSGCGNLDGFTRASAAGPRQFRVKQMMQEAAFKWRGFSLQQEFHWKDVIDRTNNTRSHLIGAYAQAGYFFHNIFPFVPEPLEIAFRYAFVDQPNSNDISFENSRQEFIGALNWFFDGHRNKLTFDYSHLTLNDRFARATAADDRVRFQWDVSF